MKNIFQLTGIFFIVFYISFFVESAHHDDTLIKAINSPARNIIFSDRDKYRNPYETLSFFKIKPDMKVLELSAGGGWYTEILAPFLYLNGKLSVTHHNPDLGGYYKRSRASFDKKVSSNPLFKGVTVISSNIPPSEGFTNPGTQDLVLTFRNLHNWLARDAMKAVMQEAYNSLKEGGFFGVVEHRAPEGSSLEFMKKSGYVTQSFAIQVATEVGFDLVATSEINANSKDTANHPKGVWTLPPSYRLKDENRSKYQEIGESDRMTLLFKK